MRKINYKSDFDAVLRLRDCKDPDKFVPWPDCDFEVVFWTSGKARCHTASRNGGTYTNCFATEDGGIHFVFDNHRMGIGTLKWEPHFALPNGIYPDGIQDIYRKADLGITLVDGEGDCPTTADVEVLVPYIKFKYGDLTDAEKAELGKPATDAAASVAELERSVETAEAGRVANEKSRVAAETTRQTDEATRQGNEAEREEAEAEREKNEDKRVQAETARAEEFAAWQGEIDSKADRSELSNVLAEEPLTPDNFPDIDTYTREQLKMDLFVDMWKAKGGPDKVSDFNEETKLFKLYDIDDIDYEEALFIDMLSGTPYAASNQENAKYFTLNNALNSIKVRALFPIGLIKADCTNMFGYHKTIEVLAFTGAHNIANIINGANMFEACSKLRRIIGNLEITNDTRSFNNCPALEEVSFYHITKNASFADSPLLSLASLQYLVTNAANTSAITITVHADVYAKLTDEANTEWHQVLIDAAAKNITFATV